MVFFFFFQAEDGIRDVAVTGVQTCALPISATLTGAIVVALAGVNVGVFGSDQAFTDKLLSSAKAAGEKMWQMPIDEEYREFIKGTVADIQNISSGKGGGATIGAMFIKEFTGDSPWIHLDIAGTAWNEIGRAHV